MSCSTTHPGPTRRRPCRYGHRRRRAVGLLAAASFAATAAQAACTPADPDPVDAPTILGGQDGFGPDAPLTFVLRTSSEASVPWTVTDAGGATVADGLTAPRGVDDASGDAVHQIVVADGLPLGDGYVVRACGGASRPFGVVGDPYTGLADDALRYFALNRAGAPIEPAWAGAEPWARPAGHPDEVVTCFEGRDRLKTRWPGCDYALDVTGGWYDAGDYGKYAVNGGISAWFLLNAVEAGFVEGERLEASLAEARWEVSFLLSLEVPGDGRLAVAKGLQEASSGRPLKLTRIEAGGLFHHKVHEEAWLPLPLAPQDADEPRFLYPPSTAATLNVVAVAAQCARVWRDRDDAFSTRCLAAAERGWAAALRHPDLYAYDAFDGGGGYSDTDLSDEFGWAATELYAATGDAAYMRALADTPGRRWLSRSADDALGDVSWQSVDLLPIMTMRASRTFSERDQKRAAALLLRAADRYLTDRAASGYAVPYPADGYAWGSNGALASRGSILAYAHEATGRPDYRRAVRDVVEVVTGRNPLDQSYVAGHGARAVSEVHHRFWAAGADGRFPPAAPGALSGGPNADLTQDPVAPRLEGCAPMRCWTEHYEAYSLNEVAINWNAPLFWVAAYLDQLDDPDQDEQPR